jgi:Hemagglutinin repeat
LKNQSSLLVDFLVLDLHGLVNQCEKHIGCNGDCRRGDLSVQGGDVQAKDINLIALGGVTLTGVQNKQVYGGGNDTTTVTTTQSLNLKADNINIQGAGASSDVTLVAANVDATNKATIAANGDVTIASGENRTTHEWTTRNEDCNWWGKCTVTVTHGLEDKTTQVGSDVKGATVDISAGKDRTTVASPRLLTSQLKSFQVSFP